MYDLDAIETINLEQLATATDRLLLRRGHSAARHLLSSVVTGVLCALAALAALV